MKFNLLLLSLLISCTLEPRYKTPESPISLSKPEEESKSIKWEDVFIDTEMQSLIKIGLKNNRNLQIAFLNIQASQALYGMKRADLLPAIGVSSTASITNKTESDSYALGVGINSYELDLFGRVRSAKKAAKEALFASNEAKNVIQISLISQIANTYIKLLIYKESAQNWSEIVNLRTENLKIVNKQFEFGLVGTTEVLQAEILLNTAVSSKLNSETSFETIKTTLLMLIGGNEKTEISENGNINDVTIADFLSQEQVPSTLLLQRPDIKQAEHNLKIANANIGVARAAFFPSINLTSFAGFASNELSTLFSNNVWSFSPSITMPIFAWGKNKNNLEYAKIQKNIQIANYEKAIQNAFEEIFYAIKNRELSTKNNDIYSQNYKANQVSFHITEIREQEGLERKTTYINAKINVLAAKESENLAKQNYLNSLINIYKAFAI